jgi:hypothetical protein
MGNPTGRIFFDGYGYRMVLPDGYVPVAIPTLCSLHLSIQIYYKIRNIIPARLPPSSRHREFSRNVTRKYLAFA